MGYIPHTDQFVIYCDEGTSQVKISTHAKFNEGFNYLPVDNLPLNYQQILYLNDTRVSPDKSELQSSDLEFFVYHFSEKRNCNYSCPSQHNRCIFWFNLKDYKLSSCTYVQDVDDMVSSSAAKFFGTCKQLQKKMHGFVNLFEFITSLSSRKDRIIGWSRIFFV